MSARFGLTSFGSLVGTFLCASVVYAQSSAPTGQFPSATGSSSATAAPPPNVAPSAPSPRKSASPRAHQPVTQPALGAAVADPPQAAQPASGTGPSAQAEPSLVPDPYASAQPLPPVTEVAAAGGSRPAGGDQTSAIERLVAQQAEWACTYESHAMTERHIVVACQEGAVLTLARTATGVQLIARRQVAGRVGELYQQDGAVWMRVVQESAERVVPGVIIDSGHQGQPEPAAATTQLPNAGAREGAGSRDVLYRAPTGTVTSAQGRDVVVQLPLEHGVEVGDRIMLTRPSKDAFASTEPVVGRVARVLDDQVLVTLGMNEVVEVGDAATTTEDLVTASRRNPPRVVDVWELRAVLRPMLNIGSVGGGLAGELGFANRRQYFRYGVHLAPLAIAGVSGQGSLFSGGGFVFGAVDHQIYSAGVGIGANTVNDTNRESEAGSGLSIVQLLRIGAVDGLNLTSRIEAVIFRSEVRFSFLQLEGQVSVADTSWLVVRGGGGSMGYGFGEVVVRNLLWGTGQKGSTFLELGLGGAGLFEHSCPELPPVVTVGDIPSCTDKDVSGPIFTAGLEWRL